LIGLLLAPAADVAGLIVAGISLLDRQARMLKRAGCSSLLLVGAEPLTPVPEGVELVSLKALAGRLGEAGAVEALVISAGLIVDERALKAVSAAEVPVMLVSNGQLIPAPGIERLDAATLSAGLMRLPARAVAEVAATLGDWDLGSTLIRVQAADASAVRLVIEDLPTYAADMRREVPMLWAVPADAVAARAAGDAILAQAQKGCLDWPARFLHPIVENTLVRLLAPSQITPNMVTLFTALLGVAAGGAFFTGHLWWGLGLALLCGPLDGVDGKLARTTFQFSRWGDLEHVLDKVLEYGWYLCVAWWFSQGAAGGLAWAVAALIILPALAESLQGEFYRRMTGSQLDDAGPFERRVRLVAGRRNTFLWSWLAMAAFGLWFQGFVMIAIYSVLTTAVAQWRFYVRLSGFARDGDARVAANYAATRYEFLAGAKPPSERLPQPPL